MRDEYDDDESSAALPLYSGFGFSLDITTVERYGLTWDEYHEMLNAQDCCCAICGQHPEVVGPLVIDHDHLYGKVRGLLCNGCNLALGHFRDDLLTVSRARAYLDRHFPHEEVAREMAEQDERKRS